MNTIGKLISSIPGTLLSSLAIETQVDKFYKKLQGEIIFKLLLYCVLTEVGVMQKKPETYYMEIQLNLPNSYGQARA